MGQVPTKTAFSFRIKKSGGVVVFDWYDVSGANTITGTSPTSTTVRFHWNDNKNPYINSQSGGFKNLDPTRRQEFDRINSNYYIKVNNVNNQYIEFGLYPSPNSGISFVSWLTMLSIVNTGFEMTCSCAVSTGDLTKANKLTNDFRYLTMLSPGNISNNGIYYNQDGSTVYFNNDNVDVDVISQEYSNLSNDNGDYLLDVDIGVDGDITLVSTYMPYIDGYNRIDDNTLLIKTTISPDNLKGIMLTNVNYNNMFVINTGITAVANSEGILCTKINNGMSFTILALLTEVL